MNGNAHGNAHESDDALAAELKKFTYVVLYEEVDADYERLLMFTDDNSICIDMNESEDVRRLCCQRYGVAALPALVYRGVLVKDNAEVAACLDAIDADYMEKTARFIDGFVQKRGLSIIIKGSVAQPRCKFTRQLIAALSPAELEGIREFNILEDQDLRYYLKRLNGQGTFPMVYTDGVFTGGLDDCLRSRGLLE
ncbi:hypothetical protein PAPHI01_2408 [Pancytospora philotis]|nr:hypothetical protein PAPHI01_2408 [Pancytospora philotis]